MAENRLPRALSKLLAHADLQVGACRKYQDTLALQRVRAEELERVTAETRAAEAELRAAHAAWSEARSERRHMDHESWDFIAHTRRSLAPHLGERWSAHWAVVGFTRPTLRVPEKFAARRHILMFLTLAFALHPEWENTETNFTPARAASVRDALKDAEARFQDSATRLYTARKARNAAVVTLNGTLRRLLKELHVVLEPADALWLAFDLKQPIRARRKRKRQTNVSIAETTPALAGPCSEEPQRHGGTGRAHFRKRWRGGNGFERDHWHGRGRKSRPCSSGNASRAYRFSDAGHIRHPHIGQVIDGRRWARSLCGGHTARGRKFAVVPPPRRRTKDPVEPVLRLLALLEATRSVARN